MKSLWLAILVIICLIIFIGSSPKLMPEGHYQDTQIVIDGKINDWGLPLRFSNPEYTIQYSVTNDDKNNYTCISVNQNSNYHPHSSYGGGGMRGMHGMGGARRELVSISSCLQKNLKIPFLFVQSDSAGSCLNL